MQANPGILYLKDPLIQTDIAPGKGPVFMENGFLLSRAQTALWQARREHGWVCAAAWGGAADIALALAAQLPVDRVALISPPQKRSKLPRELNRLRAYARRNLALITAEILLYDADSGLIQRLLRENRHSRLCVLREFDPCQLTQPWVHLAENNLLIRGKCV